MQSSIYKFSQKDEKDKPFLKPSKFTKPTIKILQPTEHNTYWNPVKTNAKDSAEISSTNKNSNYQKNS
jgi:hypothetical protein